MRNLNTETNLTILYNEKYLADLFDAVDELHNAASDNRLQDATTLNDRELVAWLKELAYTTQETIEEVERRRARIVMLDSMFGYRLCMNGDDLIGRRRVQRHCPIQALSEA